jgi:ribose transport system substrate-binding protein
MIAISALAASVLVSTAAVSGFASATVKPHRNMGPFNIVLSNSFLGNDWRIQMQKEATVAAGLYPFKGHVHLRIADSVSNTTDSQINSLKQIIASHPNAILVDASSGTALNPTLQQACNDHIVVVSFDQLATVPCAYKIDSNFTYGEDLSAAWMASVLHGKGNVWEDLGLPGVPISQTIANAWTKTFKRFPNIKVTETYYGDYALGDEQNAVSNLLNSKTDVQGILTQGYCTGAIAALQHHGHALVPMLCQSYNQTYVALAKDKGASGFIMANPAWLSILAMRTAVQVLEGHHPNKTDVLTPPCFYHGGSSPAGANCKAIKLGVNAFPNLSPNLTLPVSPPFMKISPASVNP